MAEQMVYAKSSLWLSVNFGIMAGPVFMHSRFSFKISVSALVGR